MSENTTFWTRAKIQLSNYNQRFCYISCSNCYKTTASYKRNIYHCNFCRIENVVANPRFILEVQLSDSTDTINAKLFGQMTEDYIGSPAEKIYEAPTQSNTVEL